MNGPTSGQPGGRVCARVPAPGGESPDFSLRFRGEIHDAVEYSFAADDDTYGTMIAGTGERFRTRVRELAVAVPFAAALSRAVERFASRAPTDRYLFKVDWRGGAPARLSVYFRYLDGVSARALGEALPAAGPMAWRGPPPHALGGAIGAGAPVIVALGADARGRHRSSVYFDYVAAAGARFTATVVEPMLDTLGWPSATAPAVGADVEALVRASRHVAVGVDSASEDGPNVLKLSAADVPWALARRTLERKGVPARRLADLSRVAREFRQTHVNYAAVKFGPSGYAGWKIYWAVLGRRQSGASAPRLLPA